MNVLEKARRSDALHYDYISRRDLCNMIANLESDLEDMKDGNAKLQELASLASEYISHDRCEDCVTKIACSNHELDECWMITKLHDQLRELGMEAE